MSTALAFIEVGPFRIPDHVPAWYLDRAVQLVADGSGGLILALHVGGLAIRHDESFATYLNASDLLCPDGAAVVLLARLGGARRLRRVPTTDFGHDLIRRSAEELGRPIRVALIGGPPGLATAASEALESLHDCVTSFTANGYPPDGNWQAVGLAANETRPDLCLLGLGMPLEAQVAHQLRASGFQTTIVTCGGWFGFLAGREKRAPRWAQYMGLEWVWRLAQNPKRLVPRYARGAMATASLIASALKVRWDQPGSRDKPLGGVGPGE